MIKQVRTPDYNYDFNTETGEFSRWGREKKYDPSYSPIGPEIADIEISTICHGINGIPCGHCYKSNSGIGKNMTSDEFKNIFHKINKNVIYIEDIEGNPHFYPYETKFILSDNAIVKYQELQQSDKIIGILLP